MNLDHWQRTKDRHLRCGHGLELCYEEDLPECLSTDSGLTVGRLWLAAILALVLPVACLRFGGML
jgi:hypothetical protein